MPLKTYTDNGFFFFPCKADKKPDLEIFHGTIKPSDFKKKKNQFTEEQAREFLSIGRHVGAWIPKNVIIIDLNRSAGKYDGLAEMKKVKADFKIGMAFLEETFAVRTPGKGIHLYFTTEKEFNQNQISNAITVLNHKNYIITNGSPGYEAINNCNIAPMPPELETWLEFSESAAQQERQEKEIFEDATKKLPAKKLKTILDKIDVQNFREMQRWTAFIMAALAAAGTGEEIKNALNEWTMSDIEYDGKRNVFEIVNDADVFKKVKDISIAAFVNFLHEEKISNYIINQISKIEDIESIIVDAEQKEKELPFGVIDYHYLSELPEAQEFFTLQGNTSAALVLFKALFKTVIYCHGEKANYYFDGSRWIELYDMYSVVYTILLRTLKILYSRSQDEEASAKMYKCISAINALYWKEATWKEFTRQEGIFFQAIEWDGPRNKETLTCSDGVIEFTAGKIIKRTGTREEFRRHFVDYSIDEILKADDCKNFHAFLSGIIPDENTLETLQFYISTMISGNASRRIFSIWKGSGKNGKSTLQEIIRNVIGKNLVTSFPVGLILQTRDSDGLGVTPEMARLRGVLAAFTSEVSEKNKLNVAKIKNLCGDETITANPKHKDPIEFEATWQMILLCNDFPRFDGGDFALIDRLLVIPFDVKYVTSDEERDKWITKGAKRANIKKAQQKKNFIPQIMAERAAIIKWMIEKYIELENKHDGQIPESDECKTLKNSYVKDNDNFGLFIDKFCIIDTEKDYFTSNQEITELYRHFMDNKKLSTQYVTNGIIKASNEVVKKTVKRVPECDENGNFINRPKRGLAHIYLTENKDEDLQKELKDIPF